MRSMFAAAALAAGAFASAPAAAQNASQATTKTVELDMSNYAFAPSALTFRKDASYTLHIVNKSGKDHSFSSKPFFAAVDVDPADKSKIDGGDVEVDDGQSVDIAFTAKTPGSYAFECSHFLHASFGMTGTAIVQ